jgi:Flp pilus assembly pilin Flp
MALYNWLKTLLENEEGQDLIEYALIIVLIVLVVALALPGVATAVGGVFDNISAQLAG